ncbi:S41 family peptidase [Sphingomonas sabuli]|uniref:S41 family peptidase n=1 Tax=Sphingomonas sabuli TaxID=2764186 RepID=A0A7G9L0X5_9SPHN|nr:S41 family peptidase [Sphingomonas sabuli]QNM82274.1 S41 family peptidase [Sphingomonas sabuli]
MLTASPLLAQAPQGSPTEKPAAVPFDQADAAKAVDELATALGENFVFPEAGTAYEKMLRGKLADGSYASFADARAFAETVTADLQAVHKDGHVRFRVRQDEGGPPGARRPDGPPVKSAVARSGWIGDGVAYIEFRGFPGNEETMADVRSFIAGHAKAKTLIVDIRRNGGGGLAEMNALFAELYKTPTALVTMDIRRAAEERHGTPFPDNDPLLRKVASPDTIIRREHWVTPAAQPVGLGDARVFLLTSKRTFSAAEHFSLALKRTGRATLIGEATGGGAHFGGVAPMGEGYAAFIPVGRTFDPDTGKSWEATGVAPDVAVPAEKALDEALSRAGLTIGGEAALAALK